MSAPTNFDSLPGECVISTPAIQVVDPDEFVEVAKLDAGSDAITVALATLRAERNARP